MKHKLYLISDRRLFSTEEEFLYAVERALKAGVKTFQLREKDLATRELYFLAKKLREITKRCDALLFINDRVDIALAVEADGVHLPQNGLPAYAVRKAWKDRFIIGVSTHSLKEAEDASEWADFITFGPVFHTPSKAQYGEPLGVESLKKVKEAVKCKVFAIGGIKLENLKEVLPYSDGVALIRGILAEKDIESKVKEYLTLLGE
ncbi:MAG: thiamine phosphate synthase [Thermodesulfovibrionaceae bacterium]